MNRSKEEILAELSSLATREQLNEFYKTVQSVREQELLAVRVKPGVVDLAMRLRQVKELLMECADISAKCGLAFVFTDPKGHDTHGRGWMSSACYDSDGWYRNHNASAGSVNGVPVEQILDDPEDRWYSSSSDC